MVRTTLAFGIVGGGVWWDVYRDLITNVILLDKVTGTHLAQWNL